MRKVLSRPIFPLFFNPLSFARHSPLSERLKLIYSFVCARPARVAHRCSSGNGKLVSGNTRRAHAYRARFPFFSILRLFERLPRKLL